MKRRAMYAQATAYSGGEEEGEGDGAAGDALSTNALSSIRRQPKRQVPRRCFSNLLESDSTDTDASGEDVAKEQSSTEPSIKANGMNSVLFYYWKLDLWSRIAILLFVFLPLLTFCVFIFPSLYYLC